MSKGQEGSKLSATTNMSIEGDANWHAHFVSVSALLKMGKGKLARQAINIGLPVLVKKLCSEELLPFVERHMEAMGIRVKGQE